MTSRRLFLVAGASSGLAACANVSSDYRFDGSNVGLLVGSMTTELGTGHYSLRIVSAEVGKPSPVGPRFGSSMIPAIPPMRDDDLKTDGATFAIEYPAGQYMFNSWNVRKGYTDRTSGTPFEVPLVIEPGKATYLGNVHWTRNWTATLSDQAERDLPLLARRYAALAKAPVALAIEPGARLAGLGGKVQRSTQIPLFIPIQGTR